MNYSKWIVVLLIPVSLLCIVVLIVGGVWWHNANVVAEKAAKVRAAQEQIERQHAERQAALAGDRACRSTLEMLGESLSLYASEHRGAYPDSLSALDLGPGWAVECPVSHSAYLYFRPAKASDRFGASAGGVVVACDAGPAHDGSGFFLCLDGVVREAGKVNAPRILGELKAGKNPPEWGASEYE